MKTYLRNKVDESRYPEASENETVVYREHGRCFDNVTYESFYFCWFKDEAGAYVLKVKHGGGTEIIYRGHSMRPVIESMEAMSSDARYFLMYSMYTASRESGRREREKTKEEYINAFITGRLKKRKCKGYIKTWIEVN